MSVSFYQLGYNKLSQIIFEWQDGERASLLSLFILVEVMLHWAWCLMVWVNKDQLSSYLDMSIFIPLWLCVTLVALFYLWLTEYFYRIKNQPFKLIFYQWVLVIVYGIYTSSLTLVMGYSSLIAGISLVGGTMLAMLLINRRIVWYTFLVYVCLILLLTVMPYFGGHLPEFRQLPLHAFTSDQSLSVLHTGNHVAIPLETTQVGMLNEVAVTSMTTTSSMVTQHGNALFWRMSYFYFTLPKAIIIVYIFNTLLSIIDSNKRRIQHHADHDMLTGIKNRRCVLSSIQQSIFDDNKNSDEITHGQDYSIILLDLDSFKAINDNYGHQAGDKVLQDVANILTSTFDERYMVSRYGGEEFLVALPKTPHDEAIQIAEKLREDIQDHVVHVSGGIQNYLTASSGVATLTNEEVWMLRQNYQNVLAEGKGKAIYDSQFTEHIIESLIDLADNALYEAKRTGRNKVVSATELVLTEKISKPRFIL